ncbi:MAG: restriction endonuclease subunit S [Phenylobacterium sp.]|uniref:restriction endonuclease subunit S n=1 Tax=Phenylobacterium sp. TaxID=1871053 RepID=UPI001A3C9382|nr:restriction endonuclease subunit S [Phenylobacterium sp.]MBL8554029.1 restriction endonuclease subunit S [Phenylobacterium sp.]
MDGPWKLPDGWRWELLGSLGDWYGGGTPSKANPAFWTGGSVPWVSAKDMKADYIDDAEDKITDEAIRNSAAKRIPSGSVVCVMRSGILKHSFPVAVTRRDVTINQDLRALHPRPDVDPRFLAYYLRRTADDVLGECSKNGTTVNSIEAGRLMRRPVPLPAPGTQRRIVDRIEELFTEIGEGRRSYARACMQFDAYRRSVLQAAVMGDLTSDWRRGRSVSETGGQLVERIAQLRKEQGVSRPGRSENGSSPNEAERSPLPADWTWATWDQVGSSQNGRAFPSTDYSSEGVKLLRPGNLSASGALAWTPDNTRRLPERYAAENDDLLVRGGELIMNLTAQSLRDDFLGRVCRTGSDDRCLLNQRLARLTPSLVDPEFLLRVFQSPIFRRFVGDLNTGSLIQHMYTRQLAGFAFPIPPLDEQAEIARRVRTSLSVAPDDWIDVSTVDALRAGVLAAAFRGDLVA